MPYSFQSLPNTLSKLQEVYTEAVNSSLTAGKYAKAYDLLFAMICVDASGNPIISEASASSINLSTWKLSDYNTSQWRPAVGVDEGAWVFLRGVSQVNLGPATPGGETDYSKFIRAYTEEQYRSRYGDNHLSPSQLDSAVQKASDDIARNILRDLLNQDPSRPNPAHNVPSINDIAQHDASAAAANLFKDGQIAGWAGNSMLLPVSHSASYRANILHSATYGGDGDTGNTYDVLAMIHSLLMARNAVGISGTLNLITDVLTRIIPPVSGAAGILAAAARDTDTYIKNAYGSSSNLLVTSATMEITVGTSGSDSSLTGTTAWDLVHGGSGDDTIIATKGLDTIDGGLGLDAVDYSALSGSVLVTLKDSDQALTTQFIGGVFKDYSGVFDDAADSLFNVEIIKGTANDDGVLIHSIKKDLLVDGGAGSDQFSAFYAQSGVTFDVSQGAIRLNYSPSDITKFVNFEKFEGSAYNDKFIARGNATTGAFGDAFNGALGKDTADYTALPANIGITVTMNGTGGTVQGWNGSAVVGSKSDTLSNIEIIKGTASADRFSGGNGEVTFEGGAGSDLYIVNWGSVARPHIVEKAGDAGTDAIGIPLGVTPDTYERVPGTGGETVLRPQGDAPGPVYTIPPGIENVINPGGSQTPISDFPLPEKEPPPPLGPDVQGPFGDGNRAGAGGGFGDPLVLDLGAQGIVYTNARGAGSVYWDIDSDGFREQMSWIGPEDGFLALDRNGNGTIDNNSELFGDQPVNNILNGFTQLEQLDSNGDNKITSADAQFNNLKVWVDVNTDGISQSGEIKTLAQTGITAINLDYREIWDPKGETVIRQESTFVLNGMFREVVDAWFAVDQYNSEYALPYTINPATLSLPDARGYGNLPDLRIAMSLDATLRTMVQEVAGKTLAQLNDPTFHLQDKMTAILFRWAGVDDVDPSSRGSLFDAQKFGFIEAFVGVGTTNPPAPINPLGLQFYDQAWNNALGGLTGQILMQAGMKGLYSNPVYNAVTDLYSGGFLGAEQSGFQVHYNVNATNPDNQWEGWLDFQQMTQAADIYIFHAGDAAALTARWSGQIYTLPWQENQGDNIIILSGIDPTSVRMSNDTYYAISTLTVQYGAGEQINLNITRDYDTGEMIAAEIPRIAFDNGTILDFRNGMVMTDTDESNYQGGTALQDMLDGRGGNDHITGYRGNDTLIGGAGSDSLLGGAGDDTYVFRIGDSSAGLDYISEYEGEGVDTIKLTGGILPANVTITTDYGYGMVIHYSANDEINVQGSWHPDTQEFISNIERITFDNGIVWDLRTGLTKSGGTGNDTLNGSDLIDIINGDAGNDIINAGAGNDTLNGGAGNDTLYGDYGDDLYNYAGSAQGSDTIRDEGGAVDTIALTATYTSANTTLVRVGQYDLAIKSGSTQLILIQGQFDGAGSIETLRYSDGTTLNLLTYSHTLNGTPGSDYLYGVGFGGGGDTINGLGGDDYIYVESGDDVVTGGIGNDYIDGAEGNDTLSGNAGNDTIDAGSGEDTVIYDGGLDMLRGGQGNDTVNIATVGITAANMVLARAPGNVSDLQVWLSGTHAFTLQSQFSQEQGFETIRFSNGTTFNLAGVQYTGNGTSGNDYMYGIGFGGNPNDILKGNAGNDYIAAYQGDDNITGGAGDDTVDGGQGNDTYIYNSGDGVDVIRDGNGTDIIQIGTGFVKADLTWQRDAASNDMILFLKGTKAMTITDHFASDRAVETIRFSDGSTQSLLDLTIITNGTAADDYISNPHANASQNDVIQGLGGNDYIYAGEGDDALTGGTGNDFIYGESGNDTYYYNLGDGIDTINDDSGNEIIQLGLGYVISDLTWARIAGTHNLSLQLKGTQAIIIQNHFQDEYAVETVKFSNNTTFSLTNLVFTTNGTAGADNINGTNISNDAINGLAGNDNINGYGGNDTLTGGAGRDTLSGGAGDDTYIFNVGESLAGSPDRIYEYLDEGVDTIRLTGGILPANVLIWNDAYNLNIKYSANDMIVANSSRDSSGASALSSHIERILFDNGAVWDLRNGLIMIDSADGHELTGSAQNDQIDAKAGNDTLNGYAGNDVLTGGAGYDYAAGGTGDDTYVFKAGDGPSGGTMDFVYENTDEGVDTIKLTGGIQPADVRIWTDSYNLYVRYSATETIRVGAARDSSGASLIASYVEKISFDNGTVLDLRSGLTLTDTDDAHSLSGSIMADSIDGRGGDDILYGYTGNDTLTGGTGYDYLVGGSGDDTYTFKAGDGSISRPDTVYELTGEGMDTIRLTGGILPANVTLWTDTQGLHIRYSATDEVIIYGTGGSYMTPTVSPVERILFDNGTVWNLQNGFTLTDTNDSHQLVGSDLVDTVDGKGGNDYIHTFAGNDSLAGGTGGDYLSGGAGDDIYIFKAGDSSLGDNIIENAGEGIDTVKLTGGILPANVKMWTDDIGNFSIRYSATNEIHIGKNVEKISFDNGVVWDLLAALTMTDTDDAHALYGSIYNDVLDGKGGNDPLYGLDGNDTIRGGDGNDVISGGSGNDKLYGDAGTDMLSYIDDVAGVTVDLSLTTAQNTGGSGQDTISGFENMTSSAFNDMLSGTSGNNVINGMGGIDTIGYISATAGINLNLNTTSAQNTVGAGTDTIYNIENIIGSSFNDVLSGNAVANIIEGGAGNDTMNGSLGSDTASYERATAGVTVSLLIAGAQNTVGAGTDTLNAFENLRGSAFNDILTGDANNNVIEGGAGNDTLNAGAGIDTASYERASAAVRVNLSLAAAQNTGGAGTDTLSGFESIIGSAFNDTLTGNGVSNIIDGGLGNDVLNGGAGIDTASYARASAGVIVNLATGTATGADGNDTLTAIENVTGSAFGDMFFSNTGNNIFDGGLGTDCVNYSASTTGVNVNLHTGSVTGHGTDTLVSIETAIGSAYNDTFTLGTGGAAMIDGGAGADTVNFVQALSAVTVNLSESLVTGYGSNILMNNENITGSNFNDNLTGNAGVNALNGGGGNDVLYGNGGADMLTGGAGSDTFIFKAETAFGSPATVTDFNTAQGDRLDISDILEDFDPLTQVIGDYIQMTNSGSNTSVSIDRDGAATTYGWEQIATLNGVINLTDEAVLINNGNLIV